MIKYLWTPEDGVPTPKCKNCKYSYCCGCDYQEKNEYNHQITFRGDLEMNKEGNCKYYKKYGWFGIKLI